MSFIDPHFPLFLLCGCLFEENELHRIEDEINKFKQDFFRSENAILHSREIRKCEGSFQLLFDLNIKKEFYSRLNRIIENADFKIIGAAINKANHIKQYGKSADDPYELSLSFILERLFFCVRKDPCPEVFIKIEKRGKKEDQKLLNQYNSILDMGTLYVNSATFKGFIRRFESFYKKDNIIGLQIADLCAYPLARHILEPLETYIPYQIIKDKIYCNARGEIRGYGLKVFPY